MAQCMLFDGMVGLALTLHSLDIVAIGQPLSVVVATTEAIASLYFVAGRPVVATAILGPLLLHVD